MPEQLDEGPIVAAKALDTLSPSLRWNVRRAPSIELKFLVSDAMAREVEQWVDGRMQLDPHCVAALGNAYLINSIYCDTPDLAVYHKAAGYSCRKFRLRRYDGHSAVFLERKTKWGFRLLKRRIAVTLGDLERLHRGDAERDWPAWWFHRHLLARGLRPSCHISYRRSAYIGTSEQGPVRLTIDRDIVSSPHDEWAIPAQSQGRSLLRDEAVLELKFSGMLPVLFRRLVYELTLAPRTMSKYRRAIQVWGMDGTGKREVQAVHNSATFVPALLKEAGANTSL